MKVVEIFKSLQGEGELQGFAAVFIRFSGCNLRCRWCDTPESWKSGREMTAEEIYKEAESLGCASICITGGEPLLQIDNGLIDLLRMFHENGFTVEIETNGTLDFTACQKYASICMDVKCPSSGVKSDLSLLDKLCGRDMVKFVCGDAEDLEYAESVIKSSSTPAKMIITPVYGSDAHAAAEYILSHNLPVRFQVQLHKVIDVR